MSVFSIRVSDLPDGEWAVFDVSRIAKLLDSRELPLVFTGSQGSRSYEFVPDVIEQVSHEDGGWTNPSLLLHGWVRRDDHLRVRMTACFRHCEARGKYVMFLAGLARNARGGRAARASVEPWPGHPVRSRRDGELEWRARACVAATEATLRAAG